MIAPNETTADANRYGSDMGPLPPVEPPNARFLIQLFLIPLIIVAIIVAVWLMFSWLAHLGNDPKTLISDLKRLNQSSWQKAMTLADLLRNPEYDGLKDDPAVAADLAEFLEQQIETGYLDKNSVKMRMFLCRALGEFRTPVVADALCKAASTDRDAKEPNGIEINVRLSAMEALALLAKNVGPEVLQQKACVMESLLAASKEQIDELDAVRRRDNQAVEQQDQGADRLDLRTPRAELRTVAAYALGVVGGEAALDRLYYITQNDPYANARYNAATGLARHGDLRATETLLEMLDPDNAEVVADEAGAEERSWKRVLVINNAIRASRQVVDQQQGANVDKLTLALEKLVATPIKGVAIQEAQELLHDLRRNQGSKTS